MADDMERNRAFAYNREFDERYAYDGKDLGAVCREGRTVFKLWSPMAERVQLRLYRSGSARAWLRKAMLPGERGVWTLEFPESLHGMYYDYVVRAEGKNRRTADPYAVGCCCNGGRSMVVDLHRTDPPGFDSDVAPEECGERIIYELHIKDFSHDPDSGVPERYRGKYKAFTVCGSGAGDCADGLRSADDPRSEDAASAAGDSSLTGMEYLKSLGVTHVHLLPFFDYGSVDEAGDREQFNWGYDPLNYNVPEGSYATDVTDGTVRIRECKEMIQALHRAGLRVVMDVVYNHTHQADSWLERTAPGYYYRQGEDGKLSDGSGCGNDIAAGRAMADNYIADSVLYWAREYHVDGFRFDLMGLMTVELMNRIRRELDDAFGPGEKLLYGEPWSAGPSPMEEGTRAAAKENVALLEDGIAMFCDDTRDAIKGSVFDGTAPGFVNGGTECEEAVLHGVTGWRDGAGGYMPVSCNQIVNYVSAHDNFTLWDKLVLSMHGEEADFSAEYEDVLTANRLAAFIYFTCQGNLFFQAGEEFGRTKLGDENSYRSSPELNMLDWSRAAEYSGLVEYYRGLIRLRKKLPGLCDKSPLAVQRVSCQEIHREGVVSFRVDNRGGANPDKEDIADRCDGKENAGDRDADGHSGNRDSATSGWEELFIVYNGSKEDFVAELPEPKDISQPGVPQPGHWEILADGLEADCRRQVEAPEKGIRVAAGTGMMLGLAQETNRT